MTTSEAPAAPRNTEEQLVRPDIDPGNAYRLLNPSEILQDGDEFWCRNGEWYRTGDQGELVGNEFPYRRRRDEPNAGLHRTEPAAGSGTVRGLVGASGSGGGE